MATKSEEAQTSGSRSETRRTADATRNVARSKTELAARLARGLTLASVEAFTVTADTLLSAANSFLDRNRPGDQKRSVSDLAQRLPADLADSVSDAVRNLIDVPAKVARGFSERFEEGVYERE
jgi:hypothetical protein